MMRAWLWTESVLEGQEGHELVVLDHAGAVLVHLCDQALNVDRHLKFFLDDVNKLFRVHATRLVSVATERHVRVKRILFVGLVLKLALLANHSSELLQVDCGWILRVRFGHHSL